MKRTSLIYATSALLAMTAGTTVVFAQGPPPPPLPQLDVEPVAGGGDQSQIAEPPTPADPANIESEVLTRGLVHEAFAEGYVADPQATEVITKRPPDLIDEVPPADMPEGNNVEFIPGYWAFEEEEDDFIWISGLWRDLPPGQRWVPGYWNEVEGGFQWVPGFWIGADTAELNYLPQPPASLDQGPNIAAPSTNHFWVPGCWVYQTNNYQWQPGYWSQPYNNYMWVPARYRWTPRGFIFVNGYWDYPLVNRGLLFSPVRFWNRRYPYRYYGYRYRPQLAVGVGPLLIHLFVGPRYGNYYFGNYYGPNYLGRGIYPFTRVNSLYRSRYFYDPIYTHYHLPRYRPTYDRLVGWHNYFDRNAGYRPPTTYSRTRSFLDENRGGRFDSVVQQAVLSESIRDFSRAGRADRFDFRTISQQDVERISSRARNEVRDITTQRISFEGRRGPRAGSLGELANREGTANNTIDSDQVRDRLPNGRDSDNRVSSLKLPDSTTLRDRLVDIRDNGESSARFQGRAGSLDGRNPSDAGDNNPANDRRNRSSLGDANATAAQSLRERIEATRRSRGQSDSGTLGRVPQANDNSGDSPTGGSENSTRDPRFRGNASSTDDPNQRPNSGRSSAAQGSNNRSSTEPSDLRSRIEERRQEAQSRSATTPQPTPSPAESRRNRTPAETPQPTPAPRSLNQRDPRPQPTPQPSAQPQPSSPSPSPAESRRNRSSSSQAAPPAPSSGRSSTQPSDLRSRIEAARQNPTGRTIPTPSPQNQPAPSRPNGLEITPSRSRAPEATPSRSRGPEPTPRSQPAIRQSTPSASPPSRPAPSPSPSPSQSRRSRSTSSLQDLGGALRTSSERSSSPPSIRSAPTPTRSSSVEPARSAPTPRFAPTPSPSRAPSIQSRSSSSNRSAPAIRSTPPSRSPAPSSSSSSSRGSSSSSKSPAQSRRSRDK